MAVRADHLSDMFESTVLHKLAVLTRVQGPHGVTCGMRWLSNALVESVFAGCAFGQRMSCVVTLFQKYLRRVISLVFINTTTML